jgi:hypothetical protein
MFFLLIYRYCFKFRAISLLFDSLSETIKILYNLQLFRFNGLANDNEI